MFNPFKLAKAATQCFIKGVKFDRMETDCDIMKMDAMGLLRVFDAATYYREVQKWGGSLERAAYRNLCDALDGMKK